MIRKHYAVLRYLVPGAVLVKILGTVALGVVLLLACTRPAKDHPAGSAPSTAQPAAEVPATAPGTLASTPAAAPSATPTPSPSPSATPASETPSASGSAYVGCGEPIPHARLWDETTEAEVLDAIASAKTCAAQNKRRLLLEFVAPWCADCQEMAKLDETPVVSAMLQKRFERVRINVGKWDRHEALRKNFEVRALATYIIIDPKTSKLLAKTTLEPITKKSGKKLTAEAWASWLQTH